MVSITINGAAVSVPEGTTIMEAAITDCRSSVRSIEPYPGASSLY